MNEEFVSLELLERLGPLQLSHVHDYIGEGRMLSWSAGPSKKQQGHLLKHMRFLANNKPKRIVATDNFKCKECGVDFSTQQIKDIMAAGGDVSRQAFLCSKCSVGHCHKCGGQLAIGNNVTSTGQALAVLHCQICGAAAIPVDSMVSSSQSSAYRKVGCTGGYPAIHISLSVVLLMMVTDYCHCSFRCRTRDSKQEQLDIGRYIRSAQPLMRHGFHSRSRAFALQTSTLIPSLKEQRQHQCQHQHQHQCQHQHQSQHQSQQRSPGENEHRSRFLEDSGRQHQQCQCQRGPGD